MQCHGFNWHWSHMRQVSEFVEYLSGPISSYRYQYSVVHKHHNFYIHSSAFGQLGYFYSLAIFLAAKMNPEMHKSFQTKIFMCIRGKCHGVESLSNKGVQLFLFSGFCCSCF